MLHVLKDGDDVAVETPWELRDLGRPLGLVSISGRGIDGKVGVTLRLSDARKLVVAGLAMRVAVE